jgi:DNA-binding TFAR19-related protein (PDSD5 family)
MSLYPIVIDYLTLLAKSETAKLDETRSRASEQAVKTANMMTAAAQRQLWTPEARTFLAELKTPKKTKLKCRGKLVIARRAY